MILKRKDPNRWRTRFAVVPTPVGPHENALFEWYQWRPVKGQLLSPYDDYFEYRKYGEENGVIVDRRNGNR